MAAGKLPEAFKAEVFVYKHVGEVREKFVRRAALECSRRYRLLKPSEAHEVLRRKFGDWYLNEFITIKIVINMSRDPNN